MKPAQPGTAVPLCHTGNDKPNSLRRRCPQRALCLLRQALKPRRIFHGELGQDLAVEFDSALFQAADKSAVAEAVLLGGGTDAHDPDGAELALLLLASGVGKLEGALHRLFGGAVELGFCEVISAGAL